MRAGVPLRGPSQCLSYLAGSEWRLGAWDDAVVHGELAVSLARDADRVWEFGLVHGVAAMVPALRGDWEVASAHLEMATKAGKASRAPGTITAAAIAQAFLAMARGDLEDVIGAAAAVRGAGRAQSVGVLRRYDWRILEIDALIGPGGGRPAAVTWPPRPGTKRLLPRHSRPLGAAPRACECRWHWPSWRSPTPAGYALPTSHRTP